MSSLVRVENLWRYYDGEPAVSGLNMEIEAGSAYGFIGPNGAGKSTTLRVLATIDRPDAGRVFIGGVDTQREREQVRRQLGFMPDPFNLYDDLLVEDYLQFFAEVYRLPRQQRRKQVQQAIRLTRIEERRHSKCGELSKGWRQRVLLAKTLVHDPMVLLLDEPASGLDPAARIAFRDIVRTLRDLEKTIIVSSHILTELADFCDSVGIIEQGRMLVSGKVEDILHRLDPSDRLEIQVLGDSLRAEQILREIEGVVDVSLQLGAAPEKGGGELAEDGAAQDGGDLHVVEAVLDRRSSPADRAAIVRKLVGGGVDVCGLHTRRENLEDLFLKVAGRAGGADEEFNPELLREILGDA
jgi:ABC-2 type transport system ATP-binding protein